MKKAVIIGAGFSGCTVAMLLKNKGYSVTVIEKEDYIGGGCRTFFYAGHPYTYGPRHFLSKDKEIYEFLNKITPMRNLRKMNYTFIENDKTFYTYPIHSDDIAKMPEGKIIEKELQNRKKSSAHNFEEFWIKQIGETLYGKFVKNYNKKMWMLDDNKEMDFDVEVTVKQKALETGSRYEFKGWYNCYPIAEEGYNKYFTYALKDCELHLNTEVIKVDLKKKIIFTKNEKFKGDIIISTISPDLLHNYKYGELKYIGRDYHMIALPVEYALPKDVYFLYFPGKEEKHTRIVEYKKFTQHKSSFTVIGLEIPSLNNKLYPMLIKSEVEKAERYINELPDGIYSLGRIGSYRYMSIAETLRQAIDFSDSL